MRGEEMWEQGLFGDYISPSLAYAPAGGRFALSRILLKNSVIADQPLSSDEVNAQTVVVYQTGTGKQLLRADCSPIERAGQNFTLSPDGLSLAVVHADAIEIYTLPPLTDKDQTALKLAQASAPAGKQSSRPLLLRTPDLFRRERRQHPRHSRPPRSATPRSHHNRRQHLQPAVRSHATSNFRCRAGPASSANRRAATKPIRWRPCTRAAPPPPTLYSLPDDKPPAPPKTTPQ